MLKADHITVKRDNIVLDDVTLEIHPGEVVGLIGRSGAGKTTLLKSLSGLLPIEKGKILLDEKPLLDASEKLVPGYEDIQLVDQDFGLEAYHTVLENIREKIVSLPKNERDEFSDELLDLVELTELKDRQAKYLSGGEQQRLAIARALASEPRYLLLDEPFVHLDQRLRLKVVDYLKELRNIRNTSIVVVSHDGADLMGLVDRIIHLRNGNIVRDARAEEMYYFPESKEQGELLGPINKVLNKGTYVLFRPNEYKLGEPDGIEVRYLRSIHASSVIYNIFETKNNERIVLSSIDDLDTVHSIKIDKRK